MKSTLICSLALLALLGRCAQADEPVKQWRALYNKIFWTVPVSDKTTDSDMDVDVVKQDLDDLYESIHSDVDLRRSLPAVEVKAVEFWSQADKFRPKHCSVDREEELGAKYNRVLPPYPVSRCPNLMMLKELVREDLLAYCVSIQNKIVVRYIDQIPHGDKILLTESFKEEDDVDFPSVARFLAPYFGPPAETGEKFPQIDNTTRKIYEQRFKGSCSSIVSLPKDAQSVIAYAKHVGAVNRFNPSIKTWLVARKVCRFVSDFRGVLVSHLPKAIEEHYDMKRRNGGFKKMFNCFNNC